MYRFACKISKFSWAIPRHPNWGGCTLLRPLPSAPRRLAIPLRLAGDLRPLHRLPPLTPCATDTPAIILFSQCTRVYAIDCILHAVPGIATDTNRRLDTVAAGLQWRWGNGTFMKESLFSSHARGMHTPNFSQQKSLKKWIGSCLQWKRLYNF